MSASTPLSPGEIWQPRQAVPVWAGGTSPGPNRYARFRQDFAMTAGSGPIVLELTAATRYRVWLNGAFLGDGPPPAPQGRGYVDRYEITGRCRPGLNALAVLVHYVGREPEQAASLLAEVTCGSEVLAATGATWSAAESPAWKSDTYEFRMNWFDPYQEWHDSRAEVTDWPTLPVEQLAWHPAQALQSPLPLNYATPLPAMQRREVRPAAIGRVDECLELENRMRANDLTIALSMPGAPLARCFADQLEALTSSGPGVGPARLGRRPTSADGSRANPAVVFDFGRILNGCLEIEVDGPPGATLDLGFAERLIDGWFNNSLEGQFAARLILDGRRQVFRTFSWRAQRYVKLRLRSCDSEICLHRLAIVEETPALAAAAAFETDDPALTAIYRLCVGTLNLCTHEQIVDTPWREQGQWLGDVAGVSAGGLRWATGGGAWVRKWLWESVQSQRSDGWIGNITSGAPARGLIGLPIPDYSFWWIISAHEQWLFTGETELLGAVVPVVERIFAAAERFLGSDGLLHNVVGWIFVDWAKVDKRGACAPLNALYAKALLAGSALAAAAQRPDRESTWSAAYRRIKTAFGPAFWNETRRCYVDAHYQGEPSECVSEHANAAALWAGLAGPVEIQAVIETIFERRQVPATETQPFFTRVVLEALVDHGRFDLAERIVRERWGRFLAAGLATAAEEWNPWGSRRSGEFQGVLRSLSHGWSTFPAEFLLRCLPGVKILEPGFRRVTINPHRTSWDYRLRIVVPQGTIVVTQFAGRLTLITPPGIELVPGDLITA